MNAPAVSRPTLQSQTLADSADFAQRVAKARHDLRNPVAHILGFSEMLIEKAREHGYNFLRGRVELIERLGNEMAAQINACLDPAQIQAGKSDVPGLQALLRKNAARIAALTVTLGRKPLVRHDATLSDDLARIQGAARKLLELSDTALASLGEWPADPSLASSTAGSSPSTPTRILVVDDDPQNQQALQALLTGLGYTVQLADNGDQAIELAARESPSLVILDLAQSAEEGLQALQTLKGGAIPRELPVLILAGEEQTTAAIRAVELGADDYVPKPPNPILLQTRVEAALARRWWRAARQRT